MVCSKRSIGWTLEREMAMGPINRNQHGAMQYSRQLFLLSIFHPRQIPYSSLERIKKNLSGIHDRVENVGHIESDVDTTAVPGLVDDIRDAVTDFEVSSRALTGSANPTTDQTSLFLHLPYLENCLPRRRGLASDATISSRKLLASRPSSLRSLSLGLEGSERRPSP